MRIFLNIRNINFNHSVICTLTGWIACVAGGILLTGCNPGGDIQEFFERKPTEVESKMIIRDIARVRENPHIYNPLPEMYREPPRRLVTDDGVRMFYFTRQHSAQAVAADLGRLGYKVSHNPSTNQVIIHAEDEDECDVIEEYLMRTDVPPIQIHIDCIILERFADVTKDWETTLLIENLFQHGEPITIGESKFPDPALPGASLRESKRGQFGMDFGFWSRRDDIGNRMRVVIDMLESRGYLKILLNPTLETVTGKPATVQMRDRRPVPIRVTERLRSGEEIAYVVTKYEWVTDNLTVTPFAYADGSIGLKTSIDIGSASKPEGVIQTPIITQRSVEVAENRIRPGQSLVIGGMRRSENRSVIRGVPFFKDLPLVGPMFSSKDFEESATEIVFILTPSISSGSVHYTEMADMIREKHRTPDYDALLDELVADPLAGDVYARYLEDKAEEARAEAIRLERQALRADFEAEQDRLRAEQALAEMQLLEAQIEQALKEYEQAAAQTKAAQAQAQAAEQAQAELQRARREAEAAREETEQIQDRLRALEAELESLETDD